MKRKNFTDNGDKFVYGIDISHWQRDVNFDKLVTDDTLVFCISRTGDGKDLDRKFFQNWRGSGRVGIPRGTYHYFRADRGGSFQANLVIDTIDRAGGLKDMDLPPCLDLEQGARKNLPGGLFSGDSGSYDLDLRAVGEECLEFLSTIEDQMRVTPLVYTGQSFHWWFSQNPRLHDLADEFAKYPLWIPSYTKYPRMPVDSQGKFYPWEEWSLWQFTNEGTVEGIDGPVDVNKFKGTKLDYFGFVRSLRKDSSLSEAPVSPEESVEGGSHKCIPTQDFLELMNTLADTRKCITRLEEKIKLLKK